jgi:hypothetical protein
LKKKALLFSAFPLVALAVVAAFLLHSVAESHAAGTDVPHLFAARTGVKGGSTSGGGNMTYHSGPIMPGTIKAYAIFWEPTGSFVSSGYNSLILRYFGDVGSSGLYHNNTQYKDSGNNISSGATLGGSWVDTSAYPSTKLSNKQVKAEVTKAMQHNGWTAALTHTFFVFTAKGENICYGTQCSFKVFCAYHSYFNTNTIYAAMPYAGTSLAGCGVAKSPNNNIDADSTINVTSHEQIEAATDPLISAWYDSSGAEIGDKCAWTFGSVAANGSNVTWNGHPYIVQQEWDNAKSGCVLTGP